MELELKCHSHTKHIQPKPMQNKLKPSLATYVSCFFLIYYAIYRNLLSKSRMLGIIKELDGLVLSHEPVDGTYLKNENIIHNSFKRIMLFCTRLLIVSNTIYAF